ncbi:unnamed protein product [Calypogeia fissa]
MAIIDSLESANIERTSLHSSVEEDVLEEGEDKGSQPPRRRSKRQKKKHGGDSEVQGNDREGGNGVNGEEDDDEANADLSLHIVAKAEQRRKRATTSSSTAAKGIVIGEVEVRRKSTTIANVDSGTKNMTFMDLEINSAAERWVEESVPLGRNLSIEEGEVVEFREPKAPRAESPEEGELQEDADLELNPLLATELPDPRDDDNPVNPDEQEERGTRKKNKKREKREKKEKKKKQKTGGGNGDNNVIPSDNKALVIEIKDGDAEESMVMRKLLRGPRYFDPPEAQGQSCFNCGNVGHLAAACPDGPRLKPCYVCGGFGHEGRECPQKTECYVCGKVGHIAKTCPNKGAVRASALLGDSVGFGAGGGGNICLLCGRQGHEASTCYYSYDAQDLAQVQCYICSEFGHLSCAVVVDSSPMPVSCYECGEMGHTGGGCARPRRNDRDRDRGGIGNGTPSVCFKCGEEGHYARGCSKRNAPWPAPWPTEGIALVGGGGRSRNDSSRYGTPRSATRMPRWMDLQEREPRWTPLRRLNAVGADRWTGSRGNNNASDSAGRGAVASPADAGEDIDSYMGPIANFTTESPNDGYRKRRKRSWTTTSAR